MADDRIEIDLQRKETEAGWQDIVDRFGLLGAPSWFNWIGWLFALAGLTYVHETTGSLVFGVLRAISTMMMFFYFQGFFFKIDFRGLPFVRGTVAARLVSVIISGALMYGAWQGGMAISNEIARHQLGG